jgi:hypothetical protein
MESLVFPVVRKTPSVPTPSPENGTSAVRQELDLQQHMTTGVQLIDATLQGGLIGDLACELGKALARFRVPAHDDHATDSIRQRRIDTTGDPDPVQAGLVHFGQSDSALAFVAHRFLLQP